MSYLTSPDNALSTYHLSLHAPFMYPEYYPLEQQLPADRYQPVAAWYGRLILPRGTERRTVRGVLFELYLTPADQQELRGRVVRLRWSLDPSVQARVYGTARTVNLVPRAVQGAAEWRTFPIRVNHWRLVNGLESLAGSHQIDDMQAYLIGDVQLAYDPDGIPCLYINRDPVLASGRYYALVKFLALANEAGDLWRVVHFNRETRHFDGDEETVSLPPIQPMIHGVMLSSTDKLNESPVNAEGWYIYGAQDHAGTFTVRALAPRALLRVKPQRVLLGAKTARRFIRKELWRDPEQHKGQIQSVLLSQAADEGTALQDWQVGDRALLIHVYGAIGGEMTEPPAKTPIYFGHFSYGVATIVQEPLADEPSFDILYHQVYAHNGDGLVAANHSYQHYTGDRQRGWLGARPIADLLIRLDSLTTPFRVHNEAYDPLEQLSLAQEMMMARYRIGDGRGFTSVQLMNNCSQDANQALYAAIHYVDQTLSEYPPFREWLAAHPAEQTRFADLIQLGRDIRDVLLPFGVARADWREREENLGSSQNLNPLIQIPSALLSWRAMMPPIAQRAVTDVMIKHGAAVWVLRSDQVGGHDPRIAPRAPLHW